MNYEKVFLDFEILDALLGWDIVPEEIAERLGFKTQEYGGVNVLMAYNRRDGIDFIFEIYIPYENPGNVSLGHEEVHSLLSSWLVRNGDKESIRRICGDMLNDFNRTYTKKEEH